MKKNNSKKDNIDNFRFNSENNKLIEKIISRYPKSQQTSAVMPVLDLAMRQCKGWLPKAALLEVSKILNMPFVKVYEVASFYSMYNLQPIGKNFIQICTTTPCWLRGSDKVAQACYKKLNIQNGETSKDGLFTIKEVECLGACVNAPVIQINDDYFEDLDENSISQIIENFSNGKPNKIGSQLKNRKKSEPLTGFTSLMEKVDVKR